MSQNKTHHALPADFVEVPLEKFIMVDNLYQGYLSTQQGDLLAQIALLGVIDTGALYRSTLAVRTDMDGKVTSVTLQQSFNIYGLFVDFGTGRNTPRGNPGDIGKAKGRKRRRWFSRKH